MKRYEEYKATGTAWIPSIPMSWNMQKIGVLFVQRKEKVSDKDFAPISVTKNGILPQLKTAAKTDDGDNRKKYVWVISLSIVVPIERVLAVYPLLKALFR